MDITALATLAGIFDGNTAINYANANEPEVNNCLTSLTNLSWPPQLGLLHCCLGLRPSFFKSQK
jgi:hypothetical protein